MLDAGRYKKKNDVTFAMIYQTDKDYLMWCQAHLGVNSVETRRKFRLYVEMRDQKKRTRLERMLKLQAQNNSNVGTNGPKKESQKDQIVVVSMTAESLENEYRTLAKLRRMMAVMRAEKGDTDNAALKDLLEEVNKREKRLAQTTQDKTSVKRAAGASASAMDEETWDRVSFPEEQPTFAVQGAWARIVADLMSRETAMALA